jgi:Fic family protein
MYQNRINEIDELKKKIDSYRPLAPEFVKQIQNYYKIGLTYSSNALEGNTLDLAETKVVIEDGLTINGKPMKDHLETLGHVEAFNELLKLAKSDAITEDNIKTLHKLFYIKINSENAGTYRKTPVIVTGADVDFPLPQELDKKMQEFISQLGKMKQNTHPVEYSAMAHALFVNIHPFVDGNVELQGFC